MNGRSVLRARAACVTCLTAVAILSAGMRAEAAPTTVYVSPSGADVPGCGSQAHPCRTIQVGADTAAAGATVQVAAGVYTETVHVLKPLTFRGAEAGRDARKDDADAGVPSATEDTTVNGPEGGFDMSSGPGHVTIDGFTIEGAAGVSGTARGILIIGGSGYRVVNDVIRDNSQGALFSVTGPDQTVFRHNLISDNNRSGLAGGTGLFGGNAHVDDVLIDANAFARHGSSAITVAPTGEASRVVISNNTSTADDTLAALFHTSDSKVVDNTASGDTGSAIFIGGGNTTVAVRGNHISDSAAGIYLNVLFGGPASSGVTVSKNVIKRSATTGIDVGPGGATASTFDRNRVGGSTRDGINIESGNSGLLVARNVLTDNARFDCHDQTTGSGTAGTADQWQDDRGRTSSPPGLCAPPRGDDQDPSGESQGDH